VTDIPSDEERPLPGIERALLALPCPECREMGHDGMARIGNRRRECATCNNFAANVRRLTARRLKELHEDEWNALQLRVEMDLYPSVIQAYSRQKGIKE